MSGAAAEQRIGWDPAPEQGWVAPHIATEFPGLGIAWVEVDQVVHIDGTQPNYRGSVPVERLLFGTHAPFFPCESALLKLFESPLDRPQLDRIMHANARRLLG